MTTAGGGGAASASGAGQGEPARDLFALRLRDHICQCLGRPVSLLQAGCLAPLDELGLVDLRERGFGVSVTVVAADDALTRRVLDGMGQAPDDVLLGDLRTVPLAPRSFDVVHCARLIEHISHAELVLDRLVGALRPGGLLLLRVLDRDSAAGLLDRLLPAPARRALWTRAHPGAPGPLPPVYEPVASSRGIHAYTLMRGLVITQRAADRGGPARPTRASSAADTACAAISRMTGGRYADTHDQLLYVIRKPEDRFARVVLASRQPRRRGHALASRWL